MRRFVVVSLAGGVLFATLDGLINANPLARNLYSVYKPIARTTINAPAGMLIDLAYGFALAAIFLRLYVALPGRTSLARGISFGLLAGFFRVVMSVAAAWVMFELPVATLAYTLFTGVGEMLVLGIFCGLTLRPAP